MPLRDFGLIYIRHIVHYFGVPCESIDVLRTPRNFTYGRSFRIKDGAFMLEFITSLALPDTDTLVTLVGRGHAIGHCRKSADGPVALYQSGTRRGPYGIAYTLTPSYQP